MLRSGIAVLALNKQLRSPENLAAALLPAPPPESVLLRALSEVRSRQSRLLSGIIPLNPPRLLTMFASDVFAGPQGKRKVRILSFSSFLRYETLPSPLQNLSPALLPLILRLKIFLTKLHAALTRSVDDLLILPAPRSTIMNKPIRSKFVIRTTVIHVGIAPAFRRSDP